MHEHLGEDDFDHLLAREIGLTAASTGRDARAHVQFCSACRNQLVDIRQFAERLRGLSSPPSATPLAACPADDVWLLLAAHIVPPDQVDSLIDHVVTCDACGLLLHAALVDLGLAATNEEIAAVAAHVTSSRTWQADFARRLRDHVSLQNAHRSSGWRRFLNPPLLFAWVALAACLITVASWISIRSFHRIGAGSLLAAAYAEKRTIEPRIEGVAWAQLRQDRGNSSDRMGRSNLLKAEDAIASHLQKNPEDVTWLDASGRAEMLENTEDSIQSAVATLEKANRLDHGNPLISVDLASAYLLRSQFFNRPEDAGLAIELLGGVVAASPGNETAAFNYALALEKLQLNQKAIAAWSAFLDRFPSSSWCGEARQHRDALQSQTANRLQRSLAPLLGPAQFADVVATANPSAVSALDDRIEDYRDLALETWLPQAIDASSRASPESRALKALADLLIERHSDAWLHDLLAAARSKPSALPAFRALSQAASSFETTNDTLASKSAEAASSTFARSGIPSGRLQAELILAHVDQYSHRGVECERHVRAVLSAPELKLYPWMQIDAQLESAICSPIAGAQALRQAQSSIQLAASHHFPVLLLRASAAESGVYTRNGYDHRAWALATAALSSWWKGATPLIRGYNAIMVMDEIESPRQHWFLANALLNEALLLVDGDPRTTMLAGFNARLAQVEIHTGDLAGAEQSIDRIHHLLDRAAPGPQRDNLSAEAEPSLAQIDLARNQPHRAVERLEHTRSNFLNITNRYLLVDFYRTSATAYLRTGQPVRAEADLRTGIALGQSSLSQIDDEVERLSSMRHYEPLYRDIVELELRRDPARAFALWQDSRAGAVRASLNLPAGSASRTLLPPGTALISYFQMPSGVFIWVQSGLQLHGRLYPISDSQLNLLVANLIERCSDPSTPDDSWRALSVQLYSDLIAPVEPWLKGANHLILAPDGSLKKLPFNLLINDKGTMLTERYALSFTPSVDLLRTTRPWTGVSPASHALIVSGALVPGWAPLPSVATETRTVAASFQHPDLIAGAAPPPEDFARRLSAAQVFHFSGHASNSPDSVELIDAGRTEDDPLNLVATHLNRSQLVVLSACSTAQGSTGLFDDAESPVQQLLAAHVPAIVASRWNVDSEATALLMKSFYSNLLAGASPSEALRRASRTVRSQPLFARPYYWASFAVYGQS
ncbi:MAG: CHAT domain-containing protein [Terracidiphilus sp.]|nr:CHAT domain-containing protein [Terracidiphilus sp.]